MAGLAYPRVKVVISGTIQEAQDFSVGFTFTGADMTIPLRAALVTWLGDVQSAATTMLAATGAPISLASADTVYEAISAYVYPAGATSAAVQAQDALGPFPGTGPSSLPTQTSVVASLRTAASGRHYRGRVYLPATGAGLSAHQISSSSAAQAASGVATFLSTVNALTPPWGPVYACVPNSIGDFGTIIDTVIVNSRVDIQRRRADKTPSLYTQMDAVSL